MISAVLNPPALSQEPLEVPPKGPIIDSNSPDVKSSVTYDLGNRLLTIQEVTDKTLPKPPPPPIPPLVPAISSTELLKALAMQNMDRFMAFGGTIYHLGTGFTRSLITYHQGDGKAPVVFWSSFDWNLLTIGNFELPTGQQYSLMLMFSNVNVAAMEQHYAAQGMDYNVPDIPAFSAGPASFHIISGEATQRTQEDLRALHSIYDRDQEALLQTWNDREAARRKAEAEKPAIPPKPEDIVLQYRMLKPEEIQSK